MAYWILLRAICLVQIIVSGIVLVDAQIIYDMCVDNSQAHKSFTLTCANGGIFDIDVRSGTGHCKMSEADRCYGKTPSLLVAYLNCYWRSNCVINWPRDPIIVSENGGNCIGSLPSFLQINYRCFELQPKRLLIDICTNAPVLSVDNNMSGIIRSHDIYPWDYSNSHRTCSVKFYWPRGKLVVTIQHIDLSEDDSLMIGHDKTGHDMTWVNTTQSGGTFALSDAIVTVFNFSVGPESTSGRGFLLCFAFITEGTAPTDACKTITDRGDVGNTASAANDDPLPTFLQYTVARPVTPSIPEIPKRCLKKKTEKAKARCVRRFNKGRNGNTKSGRRIRKRKRGGKDDKKQRH